MVDASRIRRTRHASATSFRCRQIPPTRRTASHWSIRFESHEHRGDARLRFDQLESAFRAEHADGGRERVGGDAVGSDDRDATTLGQTEASNRLSKALRKRGFSFVGPTTAYAFMQAMGLVNDHVEGCAFRSVVEEERARFRRPQR